MTYTAMVSEDLGELLEAAGTGDREAFARLYDATAPRLFGLVLRVVGDRGFAEEILQETYLQIWDRAAGYDPAAGSALSWLLTIAHRRAVDRVRSEQAGRRRAQADAAAREAEGPAGDVADTVVATLTAESERVAVRRCLEQLTAMQRQAIELAYFGGQTYREVAETLGAALPTIKSRIRDGMRGMRTCLGGERL